MRTQPTQRRAQHNAFGCGRIRRFPDGTNFLSPTIKRLSCHESQDRNPEYSLAWKCRHLATYVRTRNIADGKDEGEEWQCLVKVVTRTLQCTVSFFRSASSLAGIYQRGRGSGKRHHVRCGGSLSANILLLYCCEVVPFELTPTQHSTY
jgi:hypothetical protein